MNKTDILRFWKHHLRTTIPRVLCFYMLIPFLILKLVSPPVIDAVRASAPSAFWILAAALAAVCLNWYVYSVVRKQRPPLLVFAYGMLIMLIITAVIHEALPTTHELRSTLAVIGGAMLLASLILFSFWCASRHSKFAHITALVIWVILFLTCCAMVYQIARDFNDKTVSVDTWITVVSLIALIVGVFMPKILASCRRASARRRKTGLAMGRIVRIIGETHLDLDDDPVTLFHTLIEYPVGDTVYETRGEVTRTNLRRYGKYAFIDVAVPVRYDPDDPADAYVERIDGRIFDLDENRSRKAELPEIRPESWFRETLRSFTEKILQKKRDV